MLQGVLMIIYLSVLRKGEFTNPYRDGNASMKIVFILSDYFN